jgi:MoaA/NifB/PqqE/SkfB family radical SAM enzyme
MMQGHSVDAYRAPLFFAWQLTNGCSARCLGCCEESGPDRTWRDELSRDAALSLGQQILDFGIPYIAFGGGEPLSVAHSLELLTLLAKGGASLKLETDGSRIDDAMADSLADLNVQCIQISIDGATAAVHERVRPGSSFGAAIGAIQRLVARGLAPQFVFVPNRFNIHEMTSAYELAATLGCSAFVTGPMMRIGRAAAAWQSLACTPEQWSQGLRSLQARASAGPETLSLSIYPWDILEEMRRRLQSPQAMLLAVPNGKVKLLNALPFAPADLREDSLESAWQAYQSAWRSEEVRDFVIACETHPELLAHANETWLPGEWLKRRASFASG